MDKHYPLKWVQFRPHLLSLLYLHSYILNYSQNQWHLLGQQIRICITKQPLICLLLLRQGSRKTATPFRPRGITSWLLYQPWPSVTDNTNSSSRWRKEQEKQVFCFWAYDCVGWGTDDISELKYSCIHNTENYTVYYLVPLNKKDINL